MFNEQKFISDLHTIDTSANDITYAEIKAIAKLLYTSSDPDSGLWNVITCAFSHGFQKGRSSQSKF